MVTLAHITDASGSIQTGGTDQLVFAANPNRMGLHIQNLSAGDLYINVSGAPAAPDGHSLKLTSGASYIHNPGLVFGQDVRIYGDTTGQQFFAQEYV